MTRLAGRSGLSRVVSPIVLAGLTALAACTPPRPPCAPGTGTPMAVFTLYLGKAVQGRADVTDAEWASFLDDTITANLPNGYTVLDAKGAWMSLVTHTTISEATKVLVVALPDDQASLAAINRIRAAYQTRFHQQLVGMTVEQACATF